MLTRRHTQLILIQIQHDVLFMTLNWIFFLSFICLSVARKGGLPWIFTQFCVLLKSAFFLTFCVFGSHFRTLAVGLFKFCSFKQTNSFTPFGKLWSSCLGMVAAAQGSASQFSRSSKWTLRWGVSLKRFSCPMKEAFRRDWLQACWKLTFLELFWQLDRRL